MIKNARNRAKELEVESKVKFELGDIRELDFDNNTFDFQNTCNTINTN